MAKINRVKCRKERKCSKCGELIHVGEEYLRGEPFRRPAICRHVKCGLYPWELSSSEYVQTVGRLQDCLTEDYDLTSEDCIEDIKTAVEELMEQLQENYDNMPEGLQYGDTGMLLEERIDALDGVIGDLDGIDYDNIREDAQDEVMRDRDFEDVDYDDLEGELLDEVNEEIDERVKDALVEAVSEALSGLDC